MYIKGAETRKCPQEFQDRLTRIGGTNKFGEPNFKIAWGQSEFIRIGNIWRDKQGTERKGYRERYLAHGMACWCILRWRGPETFGSPDGYYFKTYLELTGLPVTGEYPYTGRYEVMQALNYKEMVNGKMVVHNMPLSHVLIDQVIPMILKGEQLTFAEREAAREWKKKEEKREHEREVDEITAMMQENLPRWYGPVSYTGQGVKTTVIQKKAEQIQKYWNRLGKFNMGDLRKMLGFHTGRPPRIAH